MANFPLTDDTLHDFVVYDENFADTLRNSRPAEMSNFFQEPLHNYPYLYYIRRMDILFIQKK